MRLIDADALIDDFRSIEWTDNWPAAIIVTIAEAPTIYPIKHGRWVGKVTKYCSVCGCGLYEDFVSDYCPNCGARMDGDADAVKPCSDCQEWDCYGCKYKEADNEID